MSNFNLAANVDRLIASQAGQGANTRQAFADKAKAEEKRKRKEARQAKRQRKAEGVMGAIGSFAESVAAGLEAEGLRRAKFGESGIGMARAFSAGASEIIDFGQLQKARRKAQVVQRLGKDFTPADAGSDNDIQTIIDALTQYEATKNAGVGVADATGDDDKADEQSTGGKPDPLAMPDEPTQSESTSTQAEPQKAMEGVDEAAEALEAVVKPVDLGHPVLNNIITYPEASTLGGRAFDNLGFTVEDENDNGIPDIMENN